MLETSKLPKSYQCAPSLSGHPLEQQPTVGEKSGQGAEDPVLQVLCASRLKELNGAPAGVRLTFYPASPGAVTCPVWVTTPCQ